MSVNGSARVTVELNIASLLVAVGARVPDRPAVIQGASQLTFAGLIERSKRLGRFLHDHGLGCFAERKTLAGYESGQDLMAQLLYNGAEYLEGMVGAYS